MLLRVACLRKLADSAAHRHRQPRQTGFWWNHSRLVIQEGRKGRGQGRIRLHSWWISSYFETGGEQLKSISQSKKKEKKSMITSITFFFFSFSFAWTEQEVLERVTDIDLVINLKLREDVLLEKCLGRRICSQCGQNFNVACIDIKGDDGKPGMYMAPLLPPAGCASKLVTRSDDTEEVVKERLRIYNEMVRPVTLSGPLFMIIWSRRLQLSWAFSRTFTRYNPCQRRIHPRTLPDPEVTFWAAHKCPSRETPEEQPGSLSWEGWPGCRSEAWVLPFNALRWPSSYRAHSHMRIIPWIGGDHH